MPETDIDSASVGDKQNSETKFSVDTETTDGAMEQVETRWRNENFTQQLGYYKKIPELKSAVDAKARWVIGKGFKSNEITELALSNFRGHGKDTFNSIIQNQIRVKDFSGDSYAEVIRINESFLGKAKRFLRLSNRNDGDLLDLKPLSPEFIDIIANKQGKIIRYEQMHLVDGKRKTFKKFKPEQIFHLSRDRIADEIHGTGVIDAVEETILALNEAIRDYRVLLRRNVKPVKVWEVDTDDTTEIASIKTKIDSAGLEAENIIIPKGSVLPPTVSAVPTNATLNPLPWINTLTQKFYQEVGTPQIIVGGAQEITEANSKIAYLAWEQTIEEGQLYVEEQVLSQLNIEIDLEFPASLQNELLSDGRKDVENGITSPEDTSVQGVGLNGTA